MTKTIRLFAVAVLAAAGVLAFCSEASAGLRDRRCNTCGTSACTTCTTCGTPSAIPMATATPAPMPVAASYCKPCTTCCKPCKPCTTCCTTTPTCCPTRQVFHLRRQPVTVCANPCATPYSVAMTSAPAMIGSSVTPAAARLPAGPDGAVKPATAESPAAAPTPAPAAPATASAGCCGGCGAAAAPCCDSHRRLFASLRGRRACCN